MFAASLRRHDALARVDAKPRPIDLSFFREAHA